MKSPQYLLKFRQFRVDFVAGFHYSRTPTSISSAVLGMSAC
jgi:hypothetical protein